MTSPDAKLPRGAKAGSILLGTVESFARQIGEQDLFAVLPRVPKELRESFAFTHTLGCAVWLKVFRKGTLRAGQASRNAVELNSKLFTLGTNKDVRSTFLHEAAHIMANEYYKANCHHDWRWVRMARLFGDDAEACHSYSYLAREPAKRVMYFCVSCEKRYKSKVLRNLARYRCRCGGRLELELLAPEAKVELLRELGLKP